MNKAIKIVLIDGCELIRQGLRHMLEAEEDMKVVGAYAGAEEAVVEMTRLHPDIILMGTQLPGMNWIEATRGLGKNRTNADGDIIILAESAGYRAKALEAGAADYIVKDITSVELTQSIRQIYRNRHPLKECDGLDEEIVELVIPPPTNAALLLRFMCKLGEMFHDDFASIICTVGSWDRGTATSIRLQPTGSSSLPISLANMPEVEKVEEVPRARGVSPSFTKELGLLPRLRINPGTRFRVTLKETSMASREISCVGAL